MESSKVLSWLLCLASVPGSRHRRGRHTNLAAAEWWPGWCWCWGPAEVNNLQTKSCDVCKLLARLEPCLGAKGYFRAKFREALWWYPKPSRYYISMLQTFHVSKKSFGIQTNLISQDIVCQQIMSKSLANDRQGLPPYIQHTEYCLIIRLRHGGS